MGMDKLILMLVGPHYSKCITVDAFSMCTTLQSYTKSTFAFRLRERDFFSDIVFKDFITSFNYCLYGPPNPLIWAQSENIFFKMSKNFGQKVAQVVPFGVFSFLVGALLVIEWADILVCWGVLVGNITHYTSFIYNHREHREKRL